jgi:hypothetical protein
MPRSPSIVPEDDNRDVYLVLDDFGDLGRAWCETAETDTDRSVLIRHLMGGAVWQPRPRHRVQYGSRLVTGRDR